MAALALFSFYDATQDIEKKCMLLTSYLEIAVAVFILYVFRVDYFSLKSSATFLCLRSYKETVSSFQARLKDLV